MTVANDNQPDNPHDISYIDQAIINIANHEERLNNHEAMLASLTIAFVEIYAAIDMVLKTTIKDYSVEDQEAFLTQFEKFRTDVIKSVQEASRSGLEGLDPDTKRAVEDMAKKH